MLKIISIIHIILLTSCTKSLTNIDNGEALKGLEATIELLGQKVIEGEQTRIDQLEVINDKIETIIQQNPDNYQNNSDYIKLNQIKEKLNDDDISSYISPDLFEIIIGWFTDNNPNNDDAAYGVAKAIGEKVGVALLERIADDVPDNEDFPIPPPPPLPPTQVTVPRQYNYQTLHERTGQEIKKLEEKLEEPNVIKADMLERQIKMLKSIQTSADSTPVSENDPKKDSYLEDDSLFGALAREIFKRRADMQIDEEAWEDDESDWRSLRRDKIINVEREKILNNLKTKSSKLLILSLFKIKDEINSKRRGK